jgi:hypothetical protein
VVDSGGGAGAVATATLVHKGYSRTIDILTALIIVTDIDSIQIIYFVMFN